MRGNPFPTLARSLRKRPLHLLLRPGSIRPSGRIALRQRGVIPFYCSGVFAQNIFGYSPDPVAPNVDVPFLGLV